MAILDNIYQAHKSHAAAKSGADWANANREAFTLIAKIHRMRNEATDGT